MYDFFHCPAKHKNSIGLIYDVTTLPQTVPRHFQFSIGRCEKIHPPVPLPKGDGSPSEHGEQGDDRRSPLLIG